MSRSKDSNGSACASRVWPALADSDRCRSCLSDPSTTRGAAQDEAAELLRVGDEASTEASAITCMLALQRLGSKGVSARYVNKNYWGNLCQN